MKYTTDFLLEKEELKEKVDDAVDFLSRHFNSTEIELEQDLRFSAYETKNFGYSLKINIEDLSKEEVEIFLKKIKLIML